MTTVELPQVPELERAPVDWERHRGDKRPKILPPPGETWRNPSTNRKIPHRYYTRVTTYADAITEGYNLTAWKLRRLALGLGQRADYVRLASAYTDRDEDRDALDELVGKALEAAGPNKADLGTALHALTERIDRDEDLGTPPDEVLPDLAAYTALTQGVLAYVHREARVVCDELECAGTPDGHAHVAEPCPAGCGPEVLHIIDTKTGSIRYPGKMSTQLSIYAHSDLYDPATGERIPVEVCRSWGAIVHLPVETGEAALFWLDLEHGWRGAQLCGPVREWHRVKADDILRPFATVQPVKVVDGEVTRIEPRLASTNVKQPPAPELGEITELLAASVEQVAGREGVSDPLDGRVAEAVHRALVGDEADRQLSPEPEQRLDPECDVRVVGTNEDDELAHWCATHDSGWPHEQPAPSSEQLSQSLIDDAATRAQFALDRFEPRAILDGFVARPQRDEAPSGVRCPRTYLRVGECACVDCRPDLAAVGDDGVQPDEPLTEIDDPTTLAELYPDRISPDPAPWPGVDDVEVEQLASGPDSDATDDEPADGAPPGQDAGAVTDPSPARDEFLIDALAVEILACAHVRDLELLSSIRWREWSKGHRDLATDRHDQLEAVEAARRPVAAFEAALVSATTRGDVEAAVQAATGQPWLTDEMLDAAGRRWHEVPR